jgi:hypothetical protein
MSRKRSRNRIPALPLAVKNLIALHSLEAWPTRALGWPSAENSPKRWRWRIIKAGADPEGETTLWHMDTDQPLEDWLKRVDQHEHGVIGLDFETYSGSKTGRWSGTSISMSWVDEYGKINLADMTKFP